MKPVSPEYLALLRTRQFFLADLYTFSLAGGGALYYCGGDTDLTVNGILYPAGKQTGPYFDRKDNKAKGHQALGIQTDTLVIDVIPGTATVFGSPFQAAIRAGVFDGAEVTVEKCVMPAYGDTRRGTIKWFVGRVAEIDAGRSIATFSINSHLELLNLQLPRNLYQVPCVNNLGDATCQVSLSSYAVSETAAAGSTAVTLYCPGLPNKGLYWVRGKVAFTSGVLAGLSRMIIGVDGNGNIQLLAPFPSAPAAGDAFTITPGCNKSYSDANGCPKFNNLLHFRAFPFIPQPTVAA